MLAPPEFDKAVDLWIAIVSNQPQLKFAAWLAWFASLSVLIAILFAVYYFWFVKKNAKFTFTIVLGSLVTTIFIEFLKRITLRERPDASDLFSFPSRHVALAALLAILLIQQNPKSKIRWLLIPWVIAVAFSRMWLAQHYFTDIIVGALIGIVFAAAFIKIKIKKK